MTENYSIIVGVGKLKSRCVVFKDANSRIKTTAKFPLGWAGTADPYITRPLLLSDLCTYVPGIVNYAFNPSPQKVGRLGV